MGVCFTPESPYHRRIDIVVTAARNVAATLLYLTGSEYFNRSLRHYARQNGFYLCNHVLARADVYGKRIPQSEIDCRTEEDVFRAMRVQYRKPEERDA
jgi:DNA polymerase/3'-5' exonuclease PolX